MEAMIYIGFSLDWFLFTFALLRMPQWIFYLGLGVLTSAIFRYITTDDLFYEEFQNLNTRNNKLKYILSKNIFILFFIAVFVLLGLSVLLFFAYQIFFINKFTELKINFYLKLIVTLVLIGIGFFAGYIILIMSIFAIKDNVGFSYNGEKYYILKDARSRLESYLFMEQKLSSNDNNNENNLKYEHSNEQEILNNFSLEDVEKIPNSNFGLIEVARAGARSRWFFVEIKDAKLSFISEVPDTSPDISGEIDKEGVISPSNKDINGNEHFYKSEDSGKTFILIE